MREFMVMERLAGWVRYCWSWSVQLVGGSKQGHQAQRELGPINHLWSSNWAQAMIIIAKSVPDFLGHMSYGISGLLGYSNIVAAS